MGVILSIHSVVGEGSTIGEGTIVTQGQVIPPGKVAVGNPARIIKNIAEQHEEMHTFGRSLYVELSRRYKRGLQKLR